MDVPDDAGNSIAGTAALSICESLLIALNDLKILNDTQTRALLVEAAASHRKAIRISPHPDRHRAVVALIDRLIVCKTWNPSVLPAGDGSPAAAADDNIEMVAPAVQTQTDSER